MRIQRIKHTQRAAALTSHRENVMAKRKKKASIADICTPLAVYTVTTKGLRLTFPDDATARAVLRDVGRRIPCPAEPDEALSNYGHRLIKRLAAFDRSEYLDGGAVYALELEVTAVLAYLADTQPKRGTLP